jgi:hypothetical protein
VALFSISGHMPRNRFHPKREEDRVLRTFEVLSF